jgi:5-methylcytosine-specific restriction protein A
MPYKSLRKCTYPGCNVLVKAGRCPEHSTKKVERSAEITALYNSPQWKSMRKSHLARNPWCVDCLAEGKHTFATEVDHVRAHRGDPALFFDDRNLQSLCKSHHSRKTATEVFHEAA